MVSLSAPPSAWQTRSSPPRSPTCWFATSSSKGSQPTDLREWSIRDSASRYEGIGIDRLKNLDRWADAGAAWC